MLPGFHPGLLVRASWTGDETDSQFNGSAKQRSQADSCSGDALPGRSAQHQKPRAEAMWSGFPWSDADTLI
jgi:hypothetical protein